MTVVPHAVVDLLVPGVLLPMALAASIAAGDVLPAVAAAARAAMPSVIAAAALWYSQVTVEGAASSAAHSSRWGALSDMIWSAGRPSWEHTSGSLHENK